MTDQTPLSIICEVEAQFNSIYCLLKKANENNEEHCCYIKDLLKWILKLNFTSIKTLSTVLKIIKKATPFFKDDNEISLLAVKFLNNCLQLKQLKYIAMEAMSDLMKNNPKFIIENISDFMELYDNLYLNDDIVEGIVKATNILDYNPQTAELIKKICSPFAVKLVNL